MTGEPQRIAVTIRIRGRSAEVDFTGSAPQCAGSVNAVAAITQSAVFYVFRCLLDEQVPATSGLMRSIRVIAPLGTIVNARPPAAVAGGNVETSQRIVDTLLRALARADSVADSGCEPGHDEQSVVWRKRPAAWRRSPFAYYETIAGGAGGGPGRRGASATQSHMTNTLNTPTEVLEHDYPVRVLRYALRNGSGGDGKFSGGDGIIREIEMLADVQVGILSDRRKLPPYGLSGGNPGSAGKMKLTIKAARRTLPPNARFMRRPGRCSELKLRAEAGGASRRRSQKNAARK